MPQQITHSDGRAPGWFVAALAGIALLLVGWCLVIAWREWFLSDDFVFLALAQEPKSWGSWAHMFLPLDTRVWWSYRPLTIDVFFTLGFYAFGLHPFPYVVVSLLVHFGTGFLVYRLGTQLGFDRRVAAVAALFSVSRYPSIMEGFWISTFQHVGAEFFFLLTMSLFLDAVRRGVARYSWASCGTLVLTLLSNEMGVTLTPTLLLLALYADDFDTAPRRLLANARRVLPHTVVTAVYLVMRFAVFGVPMIERPAFLYTPTAGWHIVLNYGRHLLFVFDNEPLKLGLAALLAVAGLTAAVRQGDERRALRRLVHVNLLCLGWMVIVMLPVVGFWYAHHRFAINMEAPVSLLLGAYLNTGWELYAQQRTRLLEVALVGLVLAAIPYRVLWTRAAELQGVSNLHFLEVVSARLPDPPPGTCVVVLYGADGLATTAEAADFHFRVSYDFLFKAFYPNRDMALIVHDLRQPLDAQYRSPRCVYFTLQPDLQVTPADPTLVSPPTGLAPAR